MKLKENFFDIAFETFVYLSLLIVPVVVLPESISIFEIPKVVFFRSMVMLMLIFSILRFVKGNFSYPKTLEFGKRKEFIYFALLLGFLVLIPNILSIAPNLSFFGGYYRVHGLYTILHYFLFFFLLVLNFQKREKWEIAFRIIFISTFIVLVYGFVQKIMGDLLGYDLMESSLGRIFSTFGQPNYFAYYLLLVFFPLLHFVILKEGIRNRIVYVSLFCLVLLGIYLADSSAVYLGLAGGLIYFFVRKIGTGLSNKLAFSFVLILMFLGFSVTFANSFLKVFEDDPSFRSLNSRVVTWESAIEAIKERPIIGYGLETFGLVNQKYLDEDLYKFERTSVLPEKTHNVFLQLLVDGGIFYLCLFLGGVFLFFYKSIFSVSKEEISEKFFLESTFFASLIALCFGFFVTVHFVVVTFLLAYWLFLMGNMSVMSLKIDVNKFNFKIFSGLVVFFALGNIIFLDLTLILADYNARKGLDDVFLGNLNGGIEQLENANILYPKQAYYHYLLADIYRQLDIFDKAIEHTEMGLNYLEYENSYGELLLAKVFSEMCLSENQNCGLADAKFEKAIKIFPNSANNNFEAGIYYFEKGECEKSLKYLNNYLETVPNLFQSDSSESKRLLLKHNPEYLGVVDAIKECELEMEVN